VRVVAQMQTVPRYTKEVTYTLGPCVWGKGG
jgi:hypothetical protein